MTVIRDEDGVEMIRTRDGDLVPVIEPVPDQIPPYGPDQPCEEHTDFGYRAATCIDCWSEIKAGERPRRHLGRIYPAEGGRP